MTKKFNLDEYKESLKTPRKIHGVVYCIANLENDFVYYGRTTQKLTTRFSQHCNTDKTYIGREIQKIGKDKFFIFPLVYAEDKISLALEETELINKLKTYYPFGYNKSLSGFGPTDPWNKGLKGRQVAWNKGIKGLGAKLYKATNLKTGEITYQRSSNKPGFNSGHIIQCCKGKLKQHKGYKWEYTNDKI